MHLCTTRQYILHHTPVHAAPHASTRCITRQYTMHHTPVHAARHASNRCTTRKYTLHHTPVHLAPQASTRCTMHHTPVHAAPHASTRFTTRQCMLHHTPVHAACCIHHRYNIMLIKRPLFHSVIRSKVFLLTQFFVQLLKCNPRLWIKMFLMKVQIQ